MAGHWVTTFDASAVTRDEVMAAVRKPRGSLTRRDVMILKTRGAVYGGCCDRFADNSGCDCLEEALPDAPAADPKSGKVATCSACNGYGWTLGGRLDNDSETVRCEVCNAANVIPPNDPGE